MATCREIIRIALRKPGVVDAAVAPEAEDAAQAMSALQGLYDQWVNDGVFGRLTNYRATADYTAEEQERVFSNGYTITIPATITDDETGEVRHPLDLSLIVVAQASTQIHLYDAYQAAWVRLDGLALTTEAPLSNRGADGIACCLAERIADEYGATLGAQTIAAAATFRSALGRARDADRRDPNDPTDF